MAAARLAPAKAFQNARSEFRDMSIKELKEYEELFKQYDSNGDGTLDLQELKYMMEKLGAPQTHIALKKMIAEVDEDNDGVMSYREFLLIFRYFKTGKLQHEGLQKIAGSVASISVGKEGVGGAKNFFEQRAQEASHDTAAIDAEYHAEARAKAAEKRANKSAFKDRIGAFQ